MQLIRVTATPERVFHMAFQMTVTGALSDGFTAVEIESDDEFVGRVFELEAGWYVELREPEKLLDDEVVKAVLAAKERLLRYVNRKGTGMPEGMTVAGASLWLMQRDDGKGFTIPS
jgi:hypothetical protein